MITAITRNPFDNANKGYFVSEWLQVIVAWQGLRDAKPRLLYPWEFIRADRRTKEVHFLIAGEYSTTQDVINRGVDIQYAGADGGLMIHRAQKVANGCTCIPAMQQSRWWDLSPDKCLHKDDIIGCCVPYSRQDQAHHIRYATAEYERLMAAGSLL